MSNYWNQFYKTEKAPDYPSEFLSFALQYMAENGFTAGNSIVDIGCGNMRDALGFAQHGWKVTAIDLSDSITGVNHENITFLPKYDAIQINIYSTVYYCRFFVHTLTEEELDQFLKSIHAIMSASSILLIETRSTTGYSDKDKQRISFKSPIGQIHERNLYSKTYLTNKMTTAGFICEQVTESQDLSKYKDENPFLIRMVIRKKIDSLEYQQNIQRAIKRIDEIRTPEFIEKQKALIALFEKIAPFLEKHNIVYWVGYGTLIGCLRNEAIIPWDDDIDLCIEPNQLEKLENIDMSEIDCVFQKLTRVHCAIRFEGKLGIDIFINDENNPKNFKRDEIFPLLRKKFHQVWTYIPHKTNEMLKRRYGMRNINECVIWNHTSENNYWAKDFENRKWLIDYRDLRVSNG